MTITEEATQTLHESAHLEPKTAQQIQPAAKDTSPTESLLLRRPPYKIGRNNWPTVCKKIKVGTQEA